MTSDNRFRKPITPIVRPTWLCNLGCIYCYAGNSTHAGRMDENTLRNVIGKIVEHNSDFGGSKFIWHGGEPLVMGIDFFRKVIAIQNEFKPSHYFNNTVQTNGTLLDDEFISFFQEENFHVGLSFDGPQIINDNHRRYLSGKGTYKEISKAIEKLKNIQIGVIAVVTSHTINHLAEFYEFIHELQVNIRVNPLLYAGYANSNSQLGISPQEYGNAINFLFDRWLTEPEYKYKIEPLADIVKSLVSGKSTSCLFNRNCLDYYIGVDYAGNITPCGRWTADEYCIGNINDVSIEYAIQSHLAQDFRKSREKALDKCFGCKYINICNGGCFYLGYMNQQSLDGKDYYCEAYQIIFNHVERRLKTESISINSSTQ